MTKTHLRGRHAVAARLAVVGLRTVQLSLALAGVLLAWCPCTLALNPSLDVGQYAHTAWRIRDGFTRGFITSIAQTPDGYLWLGTEFGLVRFDGVRAVPWQPAGNTRLPTGTVYALLVTRDETLWIGTTKGLASWKEGHLNRFPQFDGEVVFSLLEDHEGTIWVGTGGLPHSGKLCAIRSGTVDCVGGDGRLGPGVFPLDADRNGNLWVGVKDGLWRWKPGDPKFYPFPGELDGIQAIVEEKDGTLLFGWKGALYQFIQGKTQSYPLPGFSGQIRAHRILRDRDGGLWIAAWNHGLAHVHNGRTDVFSKVDGLSGDTVNALFEDREGNVWVSTIDGLDRFRDFGVATLAAKQGLSRSLVGSVLADTDGTVWLATYGGLNRWNRGHVEIPEMGSAIKGGKGDGSLAGSLFEDQEGRIWVSTPKELGYFANERFVPVKGMPPGTILSITQDRAGTLWVINEQVGLIRISLQGNVRKFLWSDLGHEDNASVLAADRSRGGLWVGFYQGGIGYFNNGQVRESYAASDGLGAGRISDFHFDDDGTLWISTEGGLSRLKHNRLATMSSKNGLPCDAVHWAIEDDDHSMWLYTSCGLVRVIRSELEAWAAAVDQRDAGRLIKATVFDSSDGVKSLSDPSHYHPQVAKTSDRKLWFLPWDGVSVIDPRHLPFNKLPPPVHIEQIIADRKTYWQNLSGDASSSPPRLPPLARDLTIDYTALSLVVPEKVRFRYKLEGRDSDWQDAGNRRQAFYTDLPPRNYRFRVMACNNSGVWNEAGAFLDFSVAPAYYQTWWFRLSLVAAFLAMLAGLYRLRLQQLAREFNAGVDARVNERTRIARELHDSLLQGFQGLIFRFQAAREFLPGRPNEATEALDIALKRADKVIVEGRDTVSDLRQSVMVGSDIAQALTALGEELGGQSDNGSVPCVRVLVEGKQRELDPMMRDEIYRIGREAMRNAFRHARAQKIETEITYGDSEFVFHVRDDGIGIPTEVASQGARAGHWGLPGMRERAKKLGGQLEVWSEHGAGTEIELIIPAAIAYGGSNVRSRFWFLRKKIGVTDGKQS